MTFSRKSSSDTTLEDQLLEDLKRVSVEGQGYGSQYFGRTLQLDEAKAARNGVARIRAEALNTHKKWKELLSTIPSGNDIGVSIGSMKGNQKQAYQIVEKLLRTTNIGYNALSNLRPLMPYCSHYRMQCERVFHTDLDVDKRKDAVELLNSTEQIIFSIQGDVDSQRAQIEILSLYLQTGLTNRLRNLTWILTLLTALAFFVGAAVLGITIAR